MKGIYDNREVEHSCGISSCEAVFCSVEHPSTFMWCSPPWLKSPERTMKDWLVSLETANLWTCDSCVADIVSKPSNYSDMVRFCRHEMHWDWKSLAEQNTVLVFVRSIVRDDRRAKALLWLVMYSYEAWSDTLFGKKPKTFLSLDGFDRAACIINELLVVFNVLVEVEVCLEKYHWNVMSDDVCSCKSKSQVVTNMTRDHEPLIYLISLFMILALTRISTGL